MKLSPKEEAVLSLIGQDQAYEDEFFRRVSELKWFFPLKEKGYFSAKSDQAPQPADQEGFYSIPVWNVLPYLEKVSEQVTSTGNEKYIKELLEIMNNVSNEKIDNYRTWHYFTKILLNLPNEKITDEIINLVPIWLDSKFDTMLQGADIAGKLLSKFLNSDNPEDWKKAEKIVFFVTDIEWKVPPGSKWEAAFTSVDPYWLQKAFEKNAAKIGEVCSSDTIYAIADRLLSVLRKAYYTGYAIEHKSKIYRMENCFIEKEKYKLRLVTIPDESEKTDTETVMFESEVVDFSSKEEFINKAKDISKQNSILASMPEDELSKAVSDIYSFLDYSYMWYRSFDKPPEHLHKDDGKEILTYILAEILKSKALHKTDDTNELISKFMGDEYPYPIFKRLSIFITSIQWDNYKELFFELVDKQKVFQIDTLYYERELASLLKNNLSKFTEDDKEKINEIISEGPARIPPDAEEEKYKARWKQRWLSLLKDNPYFSNLYDEQKILSGVIKDDFTFEPFAISSWKGPEPSPITAEEILKTSNEELSKKLKEFKSQNRWDGPSIEGFSTAVKEAVKTEPGKFLQDIKPFEDTGFTYVYEIIDGLRETWNEKKDIQWGTLLGFIANYINKDEFWSDKYIVQKGGEWFAGINHEVVAGVIGELIKDGTRDDAWAFSEEYFEKAKEIVFLLLDKAEPDEEKADSDYVTHSLNSPNGKLIEAFVNLTLRIARVNKKKGIEEEPRWPEEFKSNYETALKKGIIEAYTTVGRFMPNFAYLDMKWLEDQISLLSSERGSNHWEAFIDGYLSIGIVYDDLYELMLPHYEYGLSYDFKERHNWEHLIQHISLGYLRGHETLDGPGSLFKKIVDEWEHEKIKEIIDLFWMQRNSLTEKTDESEKIRTRIIDFWKLLYDKYKDREDSSLTQEDKNILSVASKLAVILPKIDENSFKWLMLSAPYVRKIYNDSFFIEYLDRLKDKGVKIEVAKYIGEIYLKMLKTVTPDFDQAHIRSTVEFLYENGARNSASEICNKYGFDQQHFLKDIFEKYHEA